MKKSYLKLLFSLIAAMAFSVSVAAEAYTLTISDVTFDETTGTITAYSNTTEKEIIIPSSFNVGGTDYNVLAIGVEAFRNKGLTSVVLPSTVTKLSDQCFRSNDITSINLTNSLTDIGIYTLASNELTSVQIPNTITVIPHGTFHDNKLTEIEIPSTIVEIRGNAFSRNELATVIIPNSVTKIGRTAFYQNKLSTLTIPESVTELDFAAFSDNEITSVVLNEGLLSLGDEAFSDNKLSSIVFPSTLNHIGEDCLSENLFTQKVPLPLSQNGYFKKWQQDLSYRLASHEFILLIQFGSYFNATVTTDLATFSITYHANGGEHSNTVVDFTMESDAIAITDATKAGNTFNGWYSNASFTGDVVTTIATGTIENIELWAKFTPDTYTVTFKDHDGSTLKEEVVDHGSSATAPAEPTRNNYAFTGWDVEFNSISANLTVTAQYKAVYTVTFKMDAAITLKTEEVLEGDAATAPDVPQRTGYTFTGWSMAYDNVTSNLMVMAEFEGDNFTVTFADYTGEVLSTQEVEYGFAATAPANPTREHYAFTGWDVVYTYITGNLTVTALYSPTYVVVFNDYDATELKSEIVLSGANATAPDEPVRPEYDFAGWDAVFDNVTSNLIITATYAPITGVEGVEMLKVKCYPNPALSYVIVEGAIGEMVTIFNTVGAPILEQVSSSTQQKIDVSTLQSGLYIIKVGLHTEKLYKR